MERTKRKITQNEQKEIQETLWFAAAEQKIVEGKDTKKGEEKLIRK